MTEQPECQAVKERRELTFAILEATVPAEANHHDGLHRAMANGSEEKLLLAMSILQGIVNEYRNGGDQMVENCSCGQHEDWE